MGSTGPIRDANYRNNRSKSKRPKNKQVLNSTNKQVIDALRDNLDGNKIWICKDDTLEVNRKPLEGFVATPGEGVSVEDHIQTLLSAILIMLDDQLLDAIIQDEADNVIDAIFEEDKDWGYPNMSDKDMWRRIYDFDMPSEFVRRLAKQYSIQQNLAAKWTIEYLKFMYIKSIHPTAVPSENIAKAIRLHTQYTESYGALCGLLEGLIPYMPLDAVSLSVQATQYNRTQNWYYVEFGETPPDASWNGTESLTVEKSVDPGRYWIIKKFWKR